MTPEPPKKRAWDTLSRHQRRKAPGGDAVEAPEAAAAGPPPGPPPAASVPAESPPPAAPAPEAAPVAAVMAASAVPSQDSAALRRSLDEAFNAPAAAAAPDAKDKGGAATLPTWKKTGFKLTEEQAKHAMDPKVQMARLLDHARDRPVLATFILLFVVGVLVSDAVMIARKLGVDEWLMINFDLGRDAPKGLVSDWERRASGLGFLSGPPGHEKEVTDPLAQAAVDGKDKLPEKMKTPGLSGGLAGIITPEELRSGASASLVSGMSQDALGLDRGGNPLSSMILKDPKDGVHPYSPAAVSDGKAMPGGVFFGEAGEALENFASISKGHDGPTAHADYKNPDFSNMQTVPSGMTGDDLVMSMIGDDLKKEMKEYAKGGKWKLRKMEAGEKTVRHELAGVTLTANNAVIQLLQTKRSTDLGLRCATCGTETRIHDTRAPFYGEEH